MKLSLTAVLAIAPLVLIPNVAMARWIQIGDSTKGTVAWVDDESITQHDNEIVEFRLKMDNGRDKVIGTLLANCPTNQFQYQDLKVNNRATYPDNGMNEFPIQTAPSGTISGAAIQYACSAH